MKLTLKRCVLSAIGLGLILAGCEADDLRVDTALGTTTSAVTMPDLSPYFRKTGGSPYDTTSGEPAGWLAGSCTTGACAGIPGVTPNAYGLTVTPHYNGTSSTLIQSNGPASSNTLTWLKFLPSAITNYYTAAKTFTWDFWVYPLTGSTQANSFEFDFVKVANAPGYTWGWEYMIGSQCNFAKGKWDAWDQSKNNGWGDWYETPSSCTRSQFSENVWHHLVYKLNIDPTTGWYHYTSIQIDGTTMSWNYWFKGSNYPYTQGWQDYMGVHFQQDMSATAQTVGYLISSVILTYQ